MGSDELTRSCLPSDPPAADELAEARARIAAELEAIEVPRPSLAAAVGGSTATTATLVGLVLDRPALARSLKMLSVEPAADVARRYGVAPERVRLLPARLLILQAASERFGVPLNVGWGGLREGILLEGCHG
jgi:exopolyphosphatase/guanosine-5'-triphosphate,3'-diphosphate pyrophosphatase